MAESADNLEARMAAPQGRVDDLTAQLQQATQDAAAARVLAGGADRDIGEVRDEIRDFRQATVLSFNAMRADLTDLRTQVNGGFTEMRNGFTEMRRRLDATAAGLTHIAALLADLTGERGPAPG